MGSAGLGLVPSSGSHPWRGTRSWLSHRDLGILIAPLLGKKLENITAGKMTCGG